MEKWFCMEGYECGFDEVLMNFHMDFIMFCAPSLS